MLPSSLQVEREAWAFLSDVSAAHGTLDALGALDVLGVPGSIPASPAPLPQFLPPPQLLFRFPAPSAFPSPTMCIGLKLYAMDALISWTKTFFPRAWK